MDDLGVFPGTSRNSMIEHWNDGDAKYIEKGHIAFLDCHGNVWGGADLEYEPALADAASVYSYRWGELGRLQWVMITACDVVGFTRRADGGISEVQPAVTRWDQVFQGITGVLGYRSACWYRAGEPGLGSFTASVVVRELQAGRTFWQAWAAGADWLHSVLNQRAEVAVLANSVEALSDTLVSFVQERRKGLNTAAVRRRMIGRGAAPVYYYQELENSAAEYQDGSSALRGYQQISDGLWVAPTALMTPRTANQMLLEDGPRDDLITRLRVFDLAHTYTIQEPPFRVLHAFERELHFSPDEVEKLAIAVAGGAVDAPSQLDISTWQEDEIRTISVGTSIQDSGATLPVLGFGLTIEETETRAVVRIGAIPRAASIYGERSLAFESDKAVEMFAMLAKDADQIELHSSRLVYVPLDVGPAAILNPAVAVAFSSRVGDSRQSGQVII